jgi:hypothetical protein
VETKAGNSLNAGSIKIQPAHDEHGNIAAIKQILLL